jgi:hypothetical protein
VFDTLNYPSCSALLSNSTYINSFCTLAVARGSVVNNALCYKPKGRGFETGFNVFFLIYLILPAALDPGVYSASNRNEYQKQKNVSVE